MKRVIRDKTSYQQLQRASAILTVVDDLFDCKPVFKRLHTDTAKIEAQMDKWALRFYLALTRHLGLEAAKSATNGDTCCPETAASVDQLYLRILNYLNN